jgi:hypothetical protein
MYQTTHLITVQSSSQAVVDRVIQVLMEAGLQVIQSFDLQAAKTSPTHCACPYHDTELCDCQMIVLLAYNRENKPVTLVAHGKDGKTHIGILDDPSRDRSFVVDDMIRKAILSIRVEPVQSSLYSDAT